MDRKGGCQTEQGISVMNVTYYSLLCLYRLQTAMNHLKPPETTFSSFSLLTCLLKWQNSEWLDASRLPKKSCNVLDIQRCIYLNFQSKDWLSIIATDQQANLQLWIFYPYYSIIVSFRYFTICRMGGVAVSLSTSLQQLHIVFCAKWAFYSTDFSTRMTKWCYCCEWQWVLQLIVCCQLLTWGKETVVKLSSI